MMTSKNLTAESDAKVRRARARMMDTRRGGVPQTRSRESAAERGGGAHGAFIRLPVERKRRRKK